MGNNTPQKGKKKPVSSARLDEFFVALPHFRKPFALRMLRWLESAQDVAAKVAAGGSDYEDQVVFVIRLAGILTDLRIRYPGAVVEAVTGRKPQGVEVFRDEMRDELAKAIDALHRALTEDELLWLELQRHEQAHPFLDGYRPKLVDGPDWDKRESAITGKKTPIAGILDRCEKLETERGGFAATAEDIARRVVLLVATVRLRMSPVIAPLAD
jgi:hypothetical protein